jgi:hypothetical protein
MGGGSGDSVKETPLEKEQSKVALEQWSDYQTRFVPVENRFIADVTGIDTGAIASAYAIQKKAESARANAESAIARLEDKGTRKAYNNAKQRIAEYEKAKTEAEAATKSLQGVKERSDALWDNRKATVRGQTNADLAQRAAGVPLTNPNSGAIKTGMRAQTVGKVLGKGMVGANQAVDQQKVAGMQAVIDMGRGQATEANLGFGQLAQQSADSAIEKSARDMQTKKFWGDTVGSVGGVVASKFAPAGGFKSDAKFTNNYHGGSNVQGNTDYVYDL